MYLQGELDQLAVRLLKKMSAFQGLQEAVRGPWQPYGTQKTPRSKDVTSGSSLCMWHITLIGVLWPFKIISIIRSLSSRIGGYTGAPKVNLIMPRVDIRRHTYSVVGTCLFHKFKGILTNEQILC